MDREFLIRYLKERNYWWDYGAVYDRDVGLFRESYIDEITKLLELERIIAIDGIRRGGKTTVLFQLIRQLLSQNIRPKKVIYIKIDEIVEKFADLREIISLYEEMSGLSAKNDKIYFLLDEVQYLKGWDLQLKHLTDAGYKSKFIVTGSSTSLLYKQAKESLVGRITFLGISQFSFREFVYNSIVERHIKIDESWFEFEPKTRTEGLLDEKILIKRYETLLQYKEKMAYLLGQYLESGGFAEWFKIRKQEPQNPLLLWRKLLTEYFDLIIHKDVIETFGEKIRDQYLLEKLAKDVAQFSSNRFSYSKLAERLAGNKDTIREYLYYLESSSLISISEVYFKTKKAREKIEKKIYFVDEGLRRALTLDYDDGKGIETVINNHLLHYIRNGEPLAKLHYWKNGKEVDFILEAGTKVIPIEVKYQNDPEDSSLDVFMEHAKCQFGILVTKNDFKIKETGRGKIVYLPAWTFLLLI